METATPKIVVMGTGGLPGRRSMPLGISVLPVLMSKVYWILTRIYTSSMRGEISITTLAGMLSYESHLLKLHAAIDAGSTVWEELRLTFWPGNPELVPLK